MKCNNKHCLWNAFDQCCPESEELHNAAIPNTLDCPSVMRSDHQLAMYQIIDEVDEMMLGRNFKELIDIHKFVRDQRDKKIKFENGSQITLVESSVSTRGKGFFKLID
nr:hypothetical protein [Paenibacillus xylanexedens]